MSFDTYTPNLEEVKAAFANFTPPSAVRGGYKREGVKTYYPPNIPHHFARTSNDYHVESSFSKEQRPYIAQTTQRLTGLANGEVEGVPSFARSIINNFPNAGDPPTYSESLARSVENLLDAFKVKFPSYYPVLQPMMMTGGLLGLIQVLTFERVILKFVLDGTYNKENIDKSFVLDRQAFIAANPRSADGLFSLPRGDTYTYEVWCSGKPLALAISTQSRKAAMEIAQQPAPLTNYDISADENLPDNLGDRILDIVKI